MLEPQHWLAQVFFAALPCQRPWLSSKAIQALQQKPHSVPGPKLGQNYRTQRMRWPQTCWKINEDSLTARFNICLKKCFNQNDNYKLYSIKYCKLQGYFFFLFEHSEDCGLCFKRVPKLKDIPDIPISSIVSGSVAQLMVEAAARPGREPDGLSRANRWHDAGYEMLGLAGLGSNGPFRFVCHQIYSNVSMSQTKLRHERNEPPG